jgi:hypothetical protein
MVAMNPTRADRVDLCPRKLRNLWLGLMAIVSAVLTQAAAQAQTAASADRIGIDYGFVTQHYQTTWSDPTLPAGVARGMPPSAMTFAMDGVSDNEGESPMPADTISDVNSIGIADDTSEAAVLYAIDLGKNGMTMVVSTKTSLRPGDCAAVERSGTYFNLRGVNAGFCDPTNQAIITGLRSVNLAAAQRCKLAREEQKVLAVDENQPTTPGNLGILCDGS